MIFLALVLAMIMLVMMAVTAGRDEMGWMVAFGALAMLMVVIAATS